MREEELRRVIREVLAQRNAGQTAQEAELGTAEHELEDLRDVNVKDRLYVDTAVDPEQYRQLKRTTTARIGIGRTGSRYLTAPYLRFLADHAVAKDAVLTELDELLFENWGVTVYSSACDSKKEFLTRPDLGRTLSKEALDQLSSLSKSKAQVQIIIADGLSSMAVASHGRTVCESLMAGLEGMGISCAPPIAIRRARVAIMDEVSSVVGSEVTVILIGERPGLATAESLSCYMAYKAYPGMPEAKRSVISNIHVTGTPPVEAGAAAAELVRTMLDRRASGVELSV